jgi:hypothetical protein
VIYVILRVNSDISLSSKNWLFFVVVLHSLFYEVGTELIICYLYQGEFPLCLQANAEMVPKFPVATVCFSCSHPDLNSSALILSAVMTTKFLFYLE